LSRGGGAGLGWHIGHKPPTAEELSAALEAFRRGDEDGIRILYRWLNPPLLRYLSFQVGPAAEDMASDVWLAVGRALPDLAGGPVQLRAMVFTIARRRVVDRVRTRARTVVTVPLPDGDGEPVAAATTEHVALERLSASVAISALVRDLPPEQAEIVLLRVVGDLDVATVARIVGKSPAAVRVAQHRALQRLRSEWRQAPTPTWG
jgi:RNA polymerase sigma-70 factor (ECF subfamily)